MDHFRDILQQSCKSYSLLYDTVVKAVQNAEQQNYDTVTLLVKEFDVILSEIKKIDSHLYPLAEKNSISTNQDLWNERTNLIETALNFHQKSLPKLRSIMALQLTDIKKIRAGLKSMNGYHSGTQSKGRLVENTG